MKDLYMAPEAEIICFAAEEKLTNASWVEVDPGSGGYENQGGSDGALPKY